jgi:hypothetical protein
MENRPDLLSAAARVELIKAGVPFPGETHEETACRMRRLFDVVTEEELAALADVDVRTVREWRAKALDPEYIKLGRTIVYPRAAVSEWLLRRGEDLGTIWPRENRPAPRRRQHSSRAA